MEAEESDIKNVLRVVVGKKLNSVKAKLKKVKKYH